MAKNPEETKIFLKALNSISSCQNIHQVRFMVRWISMAKEQNRITNDRYIKIIDSALATRRKQL